MALGIWESQAANGSGTDSWRGCLEEVCLPLLMPIGYKMADLKFQKEKAKPASREYSMPWLMSSYFRPIERQPWSVKCQNLLYHRGDAQPDAFRFYHALNLPLKSLYGTTEGGALTGAKNDDIRLETVGPVHEGTEIKITDHGELIYRQPGIFVGYYKDPEKTAEVLKDGWFYSGDSGFIREDGHVVFVDRVKDLVELASGDKLAPQSIESRLRFSPYIKDAWVVVGKGRAYASVIIIINYNNVGRWAGQRRVAYSTFAELSQKPEVHELVEQEIDRINSTLSAGCRVKKYVNLHKEFDPEEGELTRTRKLRRAFLEERYRELIDAIYTDKTEVPIEARVRYRDGRLGTTKTTLSIKSVGGAAL